MAKFAALLGVNLKAMLTSFRFGGGKKKRAISGLGALALLAFLALYLSGTYSFLLAGQLAPLGLEKLVILLMPVMAVAMGTLFTVFAAQGVVFGGKDNDLMLSLPVSAFSLMLCRTLALYVENLVFTVFAMLPAGAAYLLNGGVGGVGFAASLLVCTALLALLPTTLSLVIGFAVAWVSGRFARKNGLAIALYLAFFAGAMVLSFRLSFAVNDVAAYAMGLQDAFSGWGLPFLLTMEGCCEGNWPALLALAGLCAGPFLLAVWLFGGRYKKIVTALASHSAKSDYKLGRVAAGGRLPALLKKEARRFFGSPIYFLNCGIGILMALGLSVAALIFRGRVAEVLGLLAAEGLELPVLPVLTAAAALLLAMVPTTAVSVSLEGRYLWILKEAPVSAGEVLGVKAGFQLLLTGLPLLICTPLLALAFSLEPGQMALFFLTGLAAQLCMALLGQFINLCLPKLDAANDTIVVKQSASVLTAMLCSFALTAAGVGVWWLCREPLGADLALLGPAALCILLSGALFALLRAREERMFLEL